MQCVITWDDTYLRSAVTQRDPYGVNTDEYLSPILERELAILFQKELAYHHEINSFPDIPYLDAYREIDEEHLSFIDGQSIEKFLRRWGFAPTDEEITAIIRRIDVSADALISFAEFEEAMRPVKLSDSDLEFKEISDDRQKEELPKAKYKNKSEFHPKLANPSKIKIENLMTGYYGLLDSYKSKPGREGKLECKLDKEFEKYCYPSTEREFDSPSKPKESKVSPAKYYHKHTPHELYRVSDKYRSPTKANVEELPLSRSYYERK